MTRGALRPISTASSTTSMTRMVRPSASGWTCTNPSESTEKWLVPQRLNPYSSSDWAADQVDADLVFKGGAGRGQG